MLLRLRSPGSSCSVTSGKRLRSVPSTIANEAPRVVEGVCGSTGSLCEPLSTVIAPCSAPCRSSASAPVASSALQERCHSPG